MAELDLDAAKAARASKEAPIVKFGGKTFTLTDELPFGVFMGIEEMSEDAEGIKAMDKVLAAMFGDQLTDFYALNPSINDIQDVIRFVSEGYEVTVGEVEASQSS